MVRVLTLLVLSLFIGLTGCSPFKSINNSSSSGSSIIAGKVCTSEEVLPVYSGVRRLSLIEIRNSVRDLLGVNNSLNTVLPLSLIHI